jgi:hypothetical protein
MQLPAGVTSAQVQKATLTLFLDHVNSAGTINVDTVSATVDSFIAMDATAAMQGWIATPGSGNGFMILANPGTSVQFDSKENTTASHPATLTIALASSGPMGPTGA